MLIDGHRNDTTKRNAPDVNITASIIGVRSSQVRTDQVQLGRWMREVKAVYISYSWDFPDKLRGEYIPVWHDMTWHNMIDCCQRNPWRQTKTRRDTSMYTIICVPYTVYMCSTNDKCSPVQWLNLHYSLALYLSLCVWGMLRLPRYRYQQHISKTCIPSVRIRSGKIRDKISSNTIRKKK